MDVERCAEILRRFAEHQKAMPAYIGSVGIFTDTKTIFTLPIMTEPMCQMHRELHECMSDFDTRGCEWYLPNRWTPHCTLALMSENDEELFYKACDLVLRSFEKISGEFDSVGLVKISFPVEELYTTELKGE